MAERYQEGKRIGNYIIEKKIGSGRMAEVYKGIYNKDGREVAIKIVNFDFAGLDAHENEKQKQLFRDETRITGHLDHENIVKTFSSGIEQIPDQLIPTKINEHPYLVMAYANAGSVRSFLQQHGGATVEQAVDFCCL